MSDVIKIRRGLDIKLKGEADKVLEQGGMPGFFAVKPTDFPGLVPKLCLRPEADVKAGTPLFYDKYHPDVQFTSPVSGKLVAINRGERRKILELVIEPSKEMEYESFEAADPKELTAEDVRHKLLASGVWPFIRQRPYHVVADPLLTPRAVFISGFDTAPLAPDYDFIFGNESGTAFQTGINALKKLTNAPVHLSLQDGYPAALAMANAGGVEFHTFRGPHPAGNVGIQIHHIQPVNKGEVVWYVNPQDVLIIGRLFEKGIYDASRIVALTGSEVKKPRYYRTHIGASMAPLLKDNLQGEEVRVISGNVLTGKKIEEDGYLGFYDSQLTVIPEGKYHELFGWALPGLKKFSFSRTFFSWLNKRKQYRLDTNMHGGERAFVMTGEYEKVLPMDIYPMHLLKAIIVEDIDKMEQLGIYEVAEEDFALCEFICPSKIEIQSVLRKGLNLMKKEMS